jgi:four helix bundle protein
MKKSLVEERSFQFAIKIVEVYTELISNRKEYTLSKQMLRSGTAIGALIKEAQHGESKADFIHKMSIALKEGYETQYWLELLQATNFIQGENANSLIRESKELVWIMVSIVRTSKQSLVKENLNKNLKNQR